MSLWVTRREKKSSVNAQLNWCREARAFNSSSHQLSRVKEFAIEKSESRKKQKKLFIVKKCHKSFILKKKIPQLIHNIFPLPSFPFCWEEFLARLRTLSFDTTFPFRPCAAEQTLIFREKRSSFSELFFFIEKYFTLFCSVSIQFLAWLEIAPPYHHPPKKETFSLLLVLFFSWWKKRVRKKRNRKKGQKSLSLNSKKKQKSFHYLEE